jgi:DNA-binding XRE family transcriptional regulator
MHYMHFNVYLKKNFIRMRLSYLRKIKVSRLNNEPEKIFYMNLKHLNLDLYGIPEDAKIQVTVFLISEDLKTRKLIKGFLDIGCDSCFCLGELCDLVLAYVGFDERPDELYDLYFKLLDAHCEKVSHKNHQPVKEAFEIYTNLIRERDKQNINVVSNKHDIKSLLKGIGNKLSYLRKNKAKELDTVARDLRITPAALIRIERGDYEIYPDLLSKLCYYYNITISGLFWEVENNQKHF